MKLSDFDYELPPELIAQFPAAERSASRLLHLDGRSGEFHDRRFRELSELVNAGDVLVMNDTRVIRARLTGRKASGGRIEVLIERVLDHERVLAQVRASKTPRAGGRLLLAHGATAEVLGREGEFFELRFLDCADVFALLERAGSVPLPPYITHEPDAADAARYQTIYAREQGAVAAPTAGLHFDDAMLAALKARGIVLAWLTLHVGAGTFQPVRVENLGEHRMHSEWYSLPQPTVDAIHAARAAGKNLIAVGTTSLRALESAAAAAAGELRAGSAETRLFIVPGYRFRVVDRLITNFHLPRSTLLMLVSAFAGMDNIRRAYRHAVEQRYRFFSYGDAMLIERQG
ncbi:MAG: tRNA preQ1(34) S-adenosylmethionine ribosyltransferase-isomerase QueA [Betaproteobacteria bacterium]|nr:tRNA preQ1(34) S-adenosylmethionine ribosyltransferase-isomerase QueA [Betaproteobacteria bacterium]